MYQPTAADMYGLGSVAGAVNSIADGQAIRSMYGLQTQQLRDQIAYQRKIMEQQIALREQERIRQQMMAQAAGDAFQNSLGQYKDFGSSMDKSGAGIAEAFQQILARQAPGGVAPAATGAVADREASSAQMYNDRSANEAVNLSKVQALAKAFSDKGIAVGRNNQLASMLANFAGGSQQVSNQEIASREGRLFQPQIIKPQPSMLGDLIFSLGMGGAMYANRPQSPDYSMRGLQLPGSGSGVGLYTPSAGSSVGLKMPASLGITGNNTVWE